MGFLFLILYPGFLRLLLLLRRLPPPPPHTPTHTHTTNTYTHTNTHTPSHTHTHHKPTHTHHHIHTHHKPTHTHNTNTHTHQHIHTHTTNQHTHNTNTYTHTPTHTHTLAGVGQPDIHLGFTWQAWHKVTSTVVLRGRRGTDGTGWRAWSGLGACDAAALCVAGVAQSYIHRRFASTCPSQVPRYHCQLSFV